jgi:hypothetical protein
VCSDSIAIYTWVEELLRKPNTSAHILIPDHLAHVVDVVLGAAVVLNGEYGPSVQTEEACRKCQSAGYREVDVVALLSR